VEKAKSVLLTILVVVSLIQSYMLGYSSPRPEPISTGQYVESELTGTPAELKDVVFPDEIILHYGKKVHTVLYPVPFLNHYRNIFDFLKQRSFDGLRKTNVFAANIDWDDIRDNYQGIEIRFQEGIPFNVLQSLMSISKEEASVENELITRIWIYKGNKDDVKTFFISDTNVVVYEAVKADVTVKDLDVRLKLGESLTKYHTAKDGDYYLPDEPLAAIQIAMPYTLYTADQLKRSLFVDPTLTRPLQERDGNQIFTDSIRGLQIRNNQHWMVFSDPVSAPVDSKNEIKANLLSTIQFINQHGGWNSTFLYSSTALRQVFGPQTLEFRQYLEGYPVMNLKNDTIGYMKVVIQKGVVSDFERSLIIPDTKAMVKSQATLEGGIELDNKLAQYSKRALVVKVFPGYKPVVKDKSVEYTPRWIAELRDGTYEVIE
jgi:regulatory protein YycH of two-component signal transduction system YycFG